MKTCPYCAEEIKDAAIRCRWCQMWLVEEVPAGAEAMAKAAEPAGSAMIPQATVLQPLVAKAEPAADEPKPVETEAAAEESKPAEPETARVEPVVVAAVAASAETAPLESAPAAASDAPAAASATAAAPAADTKVEFTHTGTRYLLGYGADYFGIWDRNAPQQAIERFPRNDPGWASAWQKYSSIELNWMDLRTGQKSG